MWLRGCGLQRSITSCRGMGGGGKRENASHRGCGLGLLEIGNGWEEGWGGCMKCLLSFFAHAIDW